MSHAWSRASSTPSYRPQGNGRPPPRRAPTPALTRRPGPARRPNKPAGPTQWLREHVSHVLDGTVTAYEYVGPDLTHVSRTGSAGDEVHWGYWTDTLGRMEARAGPMEAATWAGLSASSAPDPNAGGPLGFAYSYTDAGRLATRTGANEERTTWSYADGFVESEEVGTTSDADAITRYDGSYDGWGVLDQEEKGGQDSAWDARYTVWSRDALGRVTDVTVGDPVLGTLHTEYRDYNEYGLATDRRRSLDGVLESRVVTTTDARGRTTNLDQYLSSGLVSGIAYERGDDGLVERVTTLAGALVYDRERLTRRVTQVRSSGGSVAVLAEVTGRDTAGRNTDFALSGGASMSRTFDAMGRITAQTTTSATGDVEERATTHDWRGRVAAQAVTFNGAPATELA